MPGFTTFEVRDPYETSLVVWDRLPPRERSRLNEREVWSRSYEAADWGRFRSDPRSYRSLFSVGQSGRLRLSRIADQRGTGFSINEPGLDAFCVSVMEQGAGRLTQHASRLSSEAGQSAGLIFAGREATRLVTSDNSVRLQLWVPGALLRDSLAKLLDRPVGGPLEFAGGIDWTRGSGASLRRLIFHLFVELDDPASLLARGIGARQFEELLVQSLLLGLPHSHLNALQRQRAMAAPANVRRAEEFLRANVEEAISLEDCRQGCGVQRPGLAARLPPLP